MAFDKSALQISRIVLLTANALHFIVSVSLFVCGIVLVTDVADFNNEAHGTVLRQVFGDHSITIIGAYMIVLGISGLIVSIYGFFAGYWKSKHMLCAYSFSMIFLIFSCISTVVFTVVFSRIAVTNADESTIKNLLLQFKRDVKIINGTKIITPDVKTRTVDYVWMRIQFQQECCGVNGIDDYIKGNLSPNFKWTRLEFNNSTLENAVVPISCCKLKGRGGRIPTHLDEFVNWNDCLYKKFFNRSETGLCKNQAANRSINLCGCKDKLTSVVVQDYSKIAVGATGALLALSFLTVILSCCVCLARSSVDRQKQEDEIRHGTPQYRNNPKGTKKPIETDA